MMIRKLLRSAIVSMLFFMPQSLLASPLLTTTPGGIAKVVIHSKTPPKAYFEGVPLLVTNPVEHEWVIYAGIPLNQNIGETLISIENVDGQSKKQALMIKEKKYPEQRIRIKDKRKVTPNKEDLKRIQKEKALLDKVLNHWSPRHVHDFKMNLPVKAPISSAFGLRRVINGLPKLPHRGVDFAASLRSPITAVARGTVTLIADLFFTGKTVIVDHGQGWQTIYCHLDEVKVDLNQEVSSTTIVGLVGKSGRATGPHLHFGLNLNQARVDPTSFWNLDD